jgi:DNA topoisomerase-2
MKKGKSKRKNSDSSEEIQEENIEKIYQKKSQLEHILLRPDSYIGSIEKIEDKLWVLDEQAEKFVLKTISFVPGLYKIFDEILVNASDNIQSKIYFLIIIILNLYFLLFH